MKKLELKLELDRDQLDMLADALTQYCDNNDPEECQDSHTPEATKRDLVRRHAVAMLLRDRVDAVFAALAD